MRNFTIICLLLVAFSQLLKALHLENVQVNPSDLLLKYECTNYEIRENREILQANKNVVICNLAATINSSEHSYIDLYPMPFNNRLLVASPDQITNISIYNLLGKRQLDLNDINDFSLDLDMSKLIPGNYFIRVETNKGLNTYKLIKE